MRSNKITGFVANRLPVYVKRVDISAPTPRLWGCTEFVNTTLRPTNRESTTFHVPARFIIIIRLFLDIEYMQCFIWCYCYMRKLRWRKRALQKISWLYLYKLGKWVEFREFSLLLINTLHGRIRTANYSLGVNALTSFRVVRALDISRNNLSKFKPQLYKKKLMTEINTICYESCLNWSSHLIS